MTTYNKLSQRPKANHRLKKIQHNTHMHTYVRMCVYIYIYKVFMNQ